MHRMDKYTKPHVEGCNFVYDEYQKKISVVSVLLCVLYIFFSRKICVALFTTCDFGVDGDADVSIFVCVFSLF